MHTKMLSIAMVVLLINCCGGLLESLSTWYKDYQFNEVKGIGHLIDDYYDTVRDHRQGALWWKIIDFFSVSGESAGFAADIAEHNLGRTYWEREESTFVRNSGGVHSYKVAKKELEEITPLIGISSSDSYVKRIEKILAFINRHVHYESDMNDAFLAPIETLAQCSGDCDDFAILAAALFEYFGIDSAVGLFTSPSGGHAMTLVHLNDLGNYKCFWYGDLRSEGLQSGRWIIIEPQCTIGKQSTSDIGQWGLRAAAEVKDNL